VPPPCTQQQFKNNGNRNDDDAGVGRIKPEMKPLKRQISRFDHFLTKIMTFPLWQPTLFSRTLEKIALICPWWIGGGQCYKTFFFRC